MIFNFFSRWKKAGRAVGVTGGAGKLCAFDQDGNVISSGVDVTDAGAKIYRHYVRILSENAATVQFFLFLTIINTSADKIDTKAKFKSALGDTTVVGHVANGYIIDGDAVLHLPIAVRVSPSSGTSTAIYLQSYDPTQGAGIVLKTFSITASNYQAPSDYVMEV